MTKFRENKVRTDAALPTLTPAWSKLDPAPDRFHPGDIAEGRVTFAGRPVHFVASVHYRDGPHFEICPSSGPVLDKIRGDPVAEPPNWTACRRRFAEHWETWCESVRRDEAAIAYGRETIAGEAVTS